MLHVHNGDSSANVLRESGLEGDHLVWREALVEGPAPAGLTDDEWRQVRARHLAEAYGQEFTEVAAELRRQEEALGRCDEHDEVVLWFEHDLFCQTILVQLLERLSRRVGSRARVSLVCVSGFPGVADFRGLGQLTPAQMASLFDARSEVTPAQYALAAAAWDAYRAPDPQRLSDLLDGATSALPHLAPALRKHLARFPSACNGLGLVEQTALELLAAGPTDFPTLFRAFAAREPLYGFGDAQLWLTLRRLARAPHPLVTTDASDAFDSAPDPDTPHSTTLALTDTGRAVLASAADHVGLNGLDLWLGGVHLHSPEAVFRAH